MQLAPDLALEMMLIEQRVRIRSVGPPLVDNLRTHLLRKAADTPVEVEMEVGTLLDTEVPAIFRAREVPCLDIRLMEMDGRRARWRGMGMGMGGWCLVMGRAVMGVLWGKGGGGAVDQRRGRGDR